MRNSGAVDILAIKGIVLLLLFAAILVLAFSERNNLAGFDVVSEGDFAKVDYLAEEGSRWTIIYYQGGDGFIIPGEYFRIGYQPGTRIQILHRYKNKKDEFQIKEVNKKAAP